MRATLDGLTTRGRCLLAAGVAAALCAIVLGERDLLRVAVFIVALPLLAVFAVGRSRVGLTARRTLTPARIAVGGDLDVELVVRSGGRLGAVGLLLEDRVEATLGARPRFVVERVPRHGGVRLRYPLTPRHRGVHPVGPLVARITDPFGLAEVGRELAGPHRLVVTPATTRLVGTPNGAGAGTGELGSGRLRSGQGEDDVIVRAYRQGDDLRKVHWRSTARRDQLMVRVEERPWRGGATVLLDTRAAGYRGEGPHSGFETAVSLAASICLHLRRQDQRVHLLTTDGTSLAGGDRVDAGEEALLEALAAVRVAHRRDVVPITTTPGRELVAVLGAAAPSTMESLLRRRPRSARSSAVLLDARTWAPADRATLPDTDDTATMLRTAGWSVSTAAAGEPLALAWERLCRSGSVETRVAG